MSRSAVQFRSRAPVLRTDELVGSLLCQTLSLVESTNDMSVRLARDRSMRDLVGWLHRHEGSSEREILVGLTDEFALSFNDARLVVDRAGAGVIRAANPTNEPDALKDPVAWATYRHATGHPVDDTPILPTTDTQRNDAAKLLNAALEEGSTKGTDDVGVALIVARAAVNSNETDDIRYRLLLQAATAISGAAEHCIESLGDQPCAIEGSQTWVDASELVRAARDVTERFAAQPDPDLEERGLALVGRIVTRLQGQCHAFVGRAMLDSARCIHRNGDAERAASQVEPVLHDFSVLLDWLGDGELSVEHVIASEQLVESIDLIDSVRGSSTEREILRQRCETLLAR